MQSVVHLDQHGVWPSGMTVRPADEKVQQQAAGFRKNKTKTLSGSGIASSVAA